MAYHQMSAEPLEWNIRKMKSIQIESAHLSFRGKLVRKMLVPLTKRPDGPACQPKSIRRTYIIGAHDGSPPTSDYRDWRFATCVPNYRAMYFELWREIDNINWYLDRAYLSIYRIVDPHILLESEILCLHCDPNEPDDAPHSIYKKGPHLHILEASEPIPHSHIALQQEKHIPLVLGSVESLMEAMTWAIKMIREEVLEAI